MNRIAGILNLDGTAVDRALLERWADFLTYRGPDAQAVWVEGTIGSGHTMLRTSNRGASGGNSLVFHGAGRAGNQYLCQLTSRFGDACAGV